MHSNIWYLTFALKASIHVKSKLYNLLRSKNKLYVINRSNTEEEDITLNNIFDNDPVNA